jgi:N-acetylglucosaminyl-diphospho-decaprenol L-rhamnosyltransferase
MDGAVNERPDLSIVLVNWNVRDLLRRCLQSIEEEPGTLPTREIIVVDCASSDGSTDMVRREFPGVRLIASPDNLGYARGSNAGAAQATGRYLMIMNPDTEVVQGGLMTLVRYMDEHPNVGAAGPQLRYADGSLQSSRRRFPTLATAFWESTLLHQWFPDNRFARWYHVAEQPPAAVPPCGDVAQAVDWLVGAVLLIRRDAWERVGPLDEGYFMYFEELDWCRRCRAAGWEIHYVPQAQVVHHEGKSSEQVVAARTIRFQRSKVRYFGKYHGALWGQVIRLFLLATFGVQLAEETTKWLVGHKRPLRRERISVYWQVLRSRLSGGKP